MRDTRTVYTLPLCYFSGGVHIRSIQEIPLAMLQKGKRVFLLDMCACTFCYCTGDPCAYIHMWKY